MTLGCDLRPGAPGAPLVLVLHGLGDTRHGWQDVAPMLGLPGWGFCFAEAPDAYYGGFSWFDIDLGPPIRVDGEGVARSHRLLLTLLDRLEREHGQPCERIALLGFSQGCLLALETALRHPRPFLATVAISGWLHREADWPQACGAAARRQRILCTHGRHDQVVPITLARPRIERLRALGLDLRWAEYDKAHGLDAGDELADIRRHLLDAARCPPDSAAPGASA